MKGSNYHVRVSFVELADHNGTPGVFWFLMDDMHAVPAEGLLSELIEEGVFHGPFATQQEAHIDAEKELAARSN